MDGHVVSQGVSETGLQIVTVQMICDLGDTDIEPARTITGQALGPQNFVESVYSSLN
jgi:hypothetical protein